MGICIAREAVGREHWNAFCDDEPSYWWWSRWEWLDYQVARGGVDKSFAEMGWSYEGNYDLLAIAPLILNPQTMRYDIEGHPGPMFFLFETAFPSDYPLSVMTNPFSRERLFLRDGGWTFSTQVVDLTQTEAQLHAGIRKSYRSLINKAERTVKIVVDTTGETMEAFRQLHRQDAGRETRPKATWEMQAEWIRNGNGLAVMALDGDLPVAGTYWILYKGCSYYGSSASVQPNLTHALIWRAMRELKARGVNEVELGWLDYDQSAKGKAIAFFKTGFGGEARTIYAVEKTFERKVRLSEACTQTTL